MFCNRRKMVQEYLKRYQESLLEEKVCCENEYKKAEQKLKEDEEFRKLLAQKSDPDYEAFTPYVVHAKDKQKISELETEEKELQLKRDKLAERCTELEHRLEELKDVIAEAVELEQKCEQMEKQQNAEQTGAQNAPYINNQENLLEKIEWCEKIAVVDPYRCREELKSLIKNLKQDIDVDSCCSDTAVWEDQ